MPHVASTIARFAARRLARRAVREAVTRSVELQERKGGRKALTVSAGPFSGSIGLPPTLDDPSDII